MSGIQACFRSGFSSQPKTAVPSQEGGVAIAKAVQNIWRLKLNGAELRRAKNVRMGAPLFEKVKDLVNKPKLLKSLPLALNGQSTVYMPADVQVVIKECKSSPINRLMRMELAQELCTKKRYQHLVVPKARVYSGYIAEERLPVEYETIKEQVGLYIECHKGFTPAVREFADFLFQSIMTDIAGNTDHVYDTLANCASARFDNVLPYQHAGVFKIGLVDLEDYQQEPVVSQREACVEKCKQLLCLFPLHFDDILQIAQSYDPQILELAGELDEIRKAALQWFDLIHIKHRDFLEKKKLADLFDPLAIEPVGSKSSQRIQRDLSVLLKMESEQSEVILGANPEEKLRLFAEALPVILERVVAELSMHIKNQYVPSNDPLYAKINLLRARSFLYQKDACWMEILEQKIAAELTMLSFSDECQKTRIVQSMVDCILGILAEEKHIVWYGQTLKNGFKSIFC